MLYFFVEALGTVSWLSAVWPAIRDALRRNPVTAGKIFYIDGEPRALALARRMVAGHGLCIEHLAFDAAQIFDEEGVLVWQRLYYRDMREALDCVARQPTFRAFLEDEKASDGLKAYVRKQVLPGVTLFSGSGLWRAMYLVQVALWQARRDGIADERVTLFLNRCPWIAAIGEYARIYGGLTVVAVGRGFRPKDTLLRLMGRDALLFREKARRLFAPPEKVSRRETAPPCLALQYYGHFNLDRAQSHSDFFFWQQSDFPADRLLTLFNIPKDPLDAEKLALLSRHGMRGLALRHDAAACPGAAVHAETALLSNLGGIVNVFAGALRPLEAGWLDGQRAAFRSQKNHWKRLFERENVKVFVTWFKYNGDHCAIGEALRELGGALAVFQRSYEGNPTVQTALLADVYFGFSCNGGAVEAEAGSMIDCYVTTGYLGDHRFPLVKKEAEQVRRRLQQHGARRIAAFFDEGSFPDARWGVDAKRLQEHYAYLLEKLLLESDLGLVLKPKVPATLVKRLGPVGELLGRAVATGRCHVYQEGVLQGSAPPAQAALSADLAIHGSVASGTAAVEAALAGVPTVLIDDDGWKLSPLYKLGTGRVVFDDWEALWHTWKENCICPGAVPGFADWSPILDEIDPFRDGRAAERMGTFLKWMIEGFSAGQSREAVIAQAADRYRQAWGEDKIAAVRPALRETAKTVQGIHHEARI